MLAQNIYGTSLSTLNHPNQGRTTIERIKQTEEAAFGGILANVLTDGTSQLEIKVLEPSGKTVWSWNAKHDLKGNLPDQLHDCVSRKATTRTEAKQSEDGSLIAAIYGDAIIAVKYMPDDPESDKRVVWGVCGDSSLLGSSHSLELLPDNLLAIATSGQSQSDGIVIYNMSLGLSPNPTPIQRITQLPDIHALVWEKKTQVLWAAGTNSSIDEARTATGLINGYFYQSSSSSGQPLQQEPVSQWHIPDAIKTFTEWNNSDYHSYAKEWSAPHDLTLVPGQRTFLIATDLDIYALNMSCGRFISGQAVVDTYLKGFSPVDHRVGNNSKGQVEELPRSDIKSVIFGPDGITVYVQARWRTFFTNKLNFLIKGERQQVDLQSSIYRARYFKMK
ncbi:hypothetical protein GGI43DRAFT_431076 [Trichoderma evansii]